MKLQIVVPLTFRETECPLLLDSWVTNTPSVKMSCLQKRNCFYSYFLKNITFINVDLLRIGNRVKMCIGGLRQSLFRDRYIDNVPISNVTFLVPLVYCRLLNEYFRTSHCFTLDGCCNERVRCWETWRWWLLATISFDFDVQPLDGYQRSEGAHDLLLLSWR
jgi:hypothetical protein